MTLPRGVVDLAADLPSHDVSLLAATTSLLSREETPPGAAPAVRPEPRRALHGGAGWFNRARDFPNTRTSELPVSPEGDRAINGTPPSLAALPAVLGQQSGRADVAGAGRPAGADAAAVAGSCRRSTSSGCARRVFRWYARLREVEHKLEAHTGDPDALLKEELGELDRVVNKVAVPLSVCRRALCAAQQHRGGAQAGARGRTACGGRRARTRAGPAWLGALELPESPTCRARPGPTADHRPGGARCTGLTAHTLRYRLRGASA